jgi:rubredoxin
MNKPDLVTCPACKAGKYTLKVTTHGKPGEESIELDCPTCASTGKVTTQKAEALRREVDLWCRCTEPHDSTYHPDTRRMKHHWTCNGCGKITQIG